MEAAPNAAPSRARTWAAVAICAAAYVYVFPYYPRINNPNENVRFYMTAAIVEEHTYAIDSMRARWGWVNDAGVYDGRHFSVKAPGTSLLGVPFYALYLWGTDVAGADFDRTTALWACRVGASVLPALVFLWFFVRWLGRRTTNAIARDAIFLSVALGSLFFAYSLLFTSHTQSAACAFGAFMILYEARRSRRVGPRGAFAAGLLAAGTTLFEYPGIIISVVLSAYALVSLRPWKTLVPYAIGGAIPALLMMHFQWSAFGSPFRPGHLYVENPHFRAGHEEGFYGAATFHADGALRLLFDPGMGLFVLTPILLVALGGFVLLLRRRDTRADGLAALLCLVLTWVAISFMNNWHAGWSVGPRYLAATVPFVAFAALAGLDALAARWPRATAVAALALTAFGIVASGVPSAYYPHLPREFTLPLGELFAVLIAHDFAPHNAMNLLGVYGSASMIPLVAIALFALAWAAFQRPLRLRQSAGALAGALAIAALMLVPLVRVGDPDPAVREAVAFVTGTWDPVGHDRAAQLEARMQEAPQPSAEDFRSLADLYFAEGREREAQRTIQRSRAALRANRAP